MRRKRAALVVVAAAMSVLAGVGYSAMGETTRESSASIEEGYRTIVARCNAGQDSYCQQVPIARLAVDSRFDEAIDMLMANRESSPDFRSRCHDVSHLIGKIAYQDLGVVEVMSDLPGGCQGGVFHGAMEEWGSQSSIDDMRKVAASLCNSLSEDDLTLRDLCLHGVGHAAERSTKDWETASFFCIDVMESADVTGCVAGAVSSGILYEQSQGRTSYTDAEMQEMVQGCVRLGQEETGNCMMFIAYYALPLAVGHQFDKALTFCEQFEGVGPNCARGVGMSMLNDRPSEPLRSIAVCTSGREDLADGCLAGAAMWVAQNLDDAAMARRIAESDPAGLGPYAQNILGMIDDILTGHAKARGESPQLAPQVAPLPEPQT